MRTGVVLAVVAGLAGCVSMVRQQDLDAWVGMPVEALDTHSFFLTVPMTRTKTASGIEIRNYANGQNRASCSGSASGQVGGGWLSADSFSACTSGWVGCNNLFYIRDGKVIEYAPTGRCKTDSSVQPEPRYLRLRAT